MSAGSVCVRSSSSTHDANLGAAWMQQNAVPTTSLIGGPAPAVARQGRHKQRYAAETGERMVAG